jgi:hypothetical protein
MHYKNLVTQDKRISKLEKLAESTLQPAPQKEWVGLTEEDIYAIGKHLGQACRLGGNPDIDIDYARAIEDKIKELNT